VLPDGSDGGDLVTQIMDPKMDSGLLQPEYDFFDAWKPRLPEELIGIMDRLLCNEVGAYFGRHLRWWTAGLTAPDGMAHWFGILSNALRKPLYR
jgi:hypothetical protein